MKTTEIIIVTAAVLLGIFYGLPALMERRGSLWREIAEEREAALKEVNQDIKDRDQEIADGKQQIRDLELRTDLTLLQENIVKEREQGVLLIKAELANLQKSIVETEERIITATESHENRAQERHERMLEVYAVLTDKLKP